MEATLGELLESTYAVNTKHVDVTPEELRVKAATKTAVSVQNENRNGRHTPATGNPPPAPKKRRGISLTPKTPVKRRAAPVIDDEQEVTPVSLSTSKKEAPGSGLFEDSDKFFQLLGRSSSEPSDCQLKTLGSYIDMAVSLFGALGEIKLKIKLLEVLVRLTKETQGTALRDRKYILIQCPRVRIPDCLFKGTLESLSV